MTVNQAANRIESLARTIRSKTNNHFGIVAAVVNIVDSGDGLDVTDGAAVGTGNLEKVSAALYVAVSQTMAFYEKPEERASVLDAVLSGIEHAARVEDIPEYLEVLRDFMDVLEAKI